MLLGAYRVRLMDDVTKNKWPRWVVSMEKHWKVKHAN